MTAVRCIDICKTYRQGDEDIKALDHLSVEIEKGEFVCLMSPSGGGKTTLLNAIGGLDSPDSGEVWVGDQRIDQMSKGELAELRLANIGFVFQAYNLIPVLSAQENVEFVMQVQGVSAAERRDKSYAILEEVGLKGLESRGPAEMGGGGRQRGAGARATATRCCWPPDISAGRRFPRPSRPTSSSSARDFLRRSAAATPCTCMTNSTFSCAVRTGIR